MTVTIIDYGSGNLLSVSRALAHCGAECRISSKPNDIDSASALVLPGVGAFRDGMDGLASHGLVDAILSYAHAGRPLLGICLGMQMLASTSEEFGSHEGLGLIPGKVREIPSRNNDGELRKTPFIGWACLERPEGVEWSRSPLQGCSENDSVYLVHSFYFEPTATADLLASYRFFGDPITAAVQRGNIMGLQFHPEKSGAVGLSILRSFVSLSQEFASG